MLVVAAIAVVATAVGIWLTTDVDETRFVRPSDSVTITDRHGVVLRQHRPDGVDRRWVELDDVSPNLISAVLAVEDERFYAHRGVDWVASLRALGSAWLPGRRMSGASTLTQQLVKLVYGRPHGMWDKPREVARALRLEAAHSKAWILEQYLNRLPYGEQVEGIGRASQVYFGVQASDLSLAQAALLAGIPQAPSALCPRRHPARALTRRNLVLARMYENGRIDDESYRSALAQPLGLSERPVRPYRAPRWVDRTVRELGRGEFPSTRGRVSTSLDLALQRRTERVLSTDREVDNAAAIVVANESGQVLAYVGAVRRGDRQPGGWLDLVAAPRQPGSTLKPFVYELLFERGGTAATVLSDVQRPMRGSEGRSYRPRDYDGFERGPVRVRTALSASLNLAALEAARRVGPARIVDRLVDLGFEGVDPDAGQYGTAIALGGPDVTGYELARAYLALARGGSLIDLTGSLTAARRPRRVMNAGAVAIAVSILQDASARRRAFGDDLRALFDEEPFALKTGTSSGWRDSWAVVFDRFHTVVVWLGNPDGRATDQLSGFAGAAPLAVRALRAAYERRRPNGVDAFIVPRPELVSERICALSGERATPACPHVESEHFRRGQRPQRPCSVHQDDGSVEVAAVERRFWARYHPGARVATSRSDAPPVIVHPRTRAQLLVRPHTPVPLRVARGRDADIRWEVDGAPLSTALWRPTPGAHTLVAIGRGGESSPVQVMVIYPEGS